MTLHMETERPYKLCGRLSVQDCIGVRGLQLRKAAPNQEVTQPQQRNITFGLTSTTGKH